MIGEQSEPVPDVTVDARGRRCPAPVIELARAARTAGSGVVAVLADDPAARTDIPAWCRMRGARLLAVTAEDGWHRYLVALG